MKVEISIPSSLNEITLEQYQRFMALDKESSDEFVSRKMLDIFCGVKDVLSVRKTDVDKVVKTITEAFKQKTPLVKTFELEGIKFGFQPDLENITFGEYIDLDNLLEWPTMHRAMAVLFRPIKNKTGDLYTIEDYESSTKNSETLKKMPVSIAIGALVFFWTLSNELTRDFLRSLKKEKEAKNTQDALSSQVSMDGLAQSINLLTEILPNKKKLHDYQLANAFIHSHILLRETKQKQQK